MQTQQRQQGISLLEILLVVLIAATIISAAINYYSQTLTSTRVSQAANLLQQINKAGYEWLQIPTGAAQYHANFSELPQDPNYAGNGLDVFTSDQLMSCENKSCYSNPWQGATMVTVDGNSQYLLIKLFNLPVADCARLQQQMKNIAPQDVSQQNACLTSANKTTTYQVYL